MTPLVLRIERSSGQQDPFVARMHDAAARISPDGYEALVSLADASSLTVRTAAGCYHLARPTGMTPADLSGDVVLVFPAERRLVRVIRRGNTVNTFLITEACDQRCVMCSQPPRPVFYDHFDLYRQAVLLAPPDAVIGISGGEPLLLKAPLLPWLEVVHDDRPDVRFHILSNGQHFDATDVPVLHRLRTPVLWGIPLYAPEGALHDRLVDKNGAHARLLRSLDYLRAADAAVELRTVVMRPNLPVLPDLALVIGRHLDWVMRWAIMQIERFGYARRNWTALFVDTSRDFAPLESAIRIAELANIPVQLFNFPLCTVPPAYRSLAVPTISDWKQRYLPICAPCSQRYKCGGFFEWYRQDNGFKEVQAI